MYDDDSPIQNVFVLQHNGIISKSNDSHYLTWKDQKYYYIITDYDCLFSDEELIAIAESMYEKQDFCE